MNSGNISRATMFGIFKNSRILRKDGIRRRFYANGYINSELRNRPGTLVYNATRIQIHTVTARIPPVATEHQLVDTIEHAMKDVDNLQVKRKISASLAHGYGPKEFKQS